VIRKIGSSRSRELMLTGRSFDAIEAFELGLVHRLCKPGGLDEAVKKTVSLLLSNAPGAMLGVKELIRYLEDHPDSNNLSEKTSGLIAKYRLSDEGQEGMKAFLEKRKPNWIE
jgi:methylglutaconyl-CoA hydratase